MLHSVYLSARLSLPVTLPGHFRINDFLLFFIPLLLLNYFLLNLFLFLQKSGGAKAPPAPPSARSLLCRAMAAENPPVQTKARRKP